MHHIKGLDCITQHQMKIQKLFNSSKLTLFYYYYYFFEGTYEQMPIEIYQVMPSAFTLSLLHNFI